MNNLLIINKFHFLLLSFITAFSLPLCAENFCEIVADTEVKDDDLKDCDRLIIYFGPYTFIKGQQIAATYCSQPYSHSFVKTANGHYVHAIQCNRNQNKFNHSGEVHHDEEPPIEYDSDNQIDFESKGHRRTNSL